MNTNNKMFGTLEVTRDKNLVRGLRFTYVSQLPTGEEFVCYTNDSPEAYKQYAFVYSDAAGNYLN